MKNLIYIIFLILGLYSCNKDESLKGGTHNAYIDKSTLEYLSLNPKFDTVLILFEKAGLLETLNQKDLTLIVPTNYSVFHFVKQIKNQKRKQMNDENLEYTFSDLLDEFDIYKDSMQMYILDKYILRSDLEKKNYVKNSLLGTEMEISLKKSPLYSEWLPNINVKLVHYKYIKNGLDPVGVNVPVEDRDVSNICQTSGIITNTGSLYVLEDTHKLFFNIMPNAQ